MQTGKITFIYLFVCLFVYLFLTFIIIESYRVCAKVKGYLAYAFKAYNVCWD